MIVHITDDFDMDRIAQSGQCFRWEKTDDRTFRIVAGRSCLILSALKDGCYEFSCSEGEYDSFWMHYFDLKTNYRAIRERVTPEQDPFLWEAMENEKGIRILRQDPWEMLITFIISQNKNIPAICRSVELLAEQCGDRMTDAQGNDYYSFPGPEAVAELSEEALKECSLGYRCKYIHAAAAAVAQGEISLAHLREAKEEDTIKALTGLYGVGKKVASCISLFGLHHLDAFPIDVWVKRILEQEYPNGYPYEQYSPYNGVYQQYMFAWYRHRNI